MRALFTFFLIVTVFSVSAQDGVIVKYFDSTWSPTSKENAVYYTHFIKEDTLYKCTSYYAKSDMLFGKSTFADTLFIKGKGLMLRYFESGELKDSTLFDNNCNTIFSYNYYKNGVLYKYEYFDSIAKKAASKNYYMNGKVKPDFILQNPAEFIGGMEEWKKFLERNLNNNIPSLNSAPAGKYTVTVQFIVNKEGDISDVQAKNDPGYGCKEEAIRVIRSSPTWEPAIQNNIPVSYRAIQQINFVVPNK